VFLNAFFQLGEGGLDTIATYDPPLHGKEKEEEKGEWAKVETMKNYVMKNMRTITVDVSVCVRAKCVLCGVLCVCEKNCPPLPLHIKHVPHLL
jgi:hypothetical protein